MPKNIMILVTMLLLCACGVSAKSADRDTPEWVDNPGSAYPQDLYLSSVGSGMTRKDAENDAVGSLSKRFSTTVQVSETWIRRYQELTQDNQTSLTDRVGTSRDITLSSGQTLYNVQFGESWTAPDGRVHIIAYMDRLQTGQIYEEKISANTERVVAYLKQADSATRIPERISALRGAMVFARQNEMLLEQLSIISPTMKEFVEIPYSLPEIVGRMRSTMGQIDLRVHIAGDDDGRVTQLVTDMLTRQGFVISRNGAWKLSGSVDYEQVDLQDGAVFIRWNLSLGLEDESGKKIVTRSDRKRVGKLTYQAAKAAAVREMEEVIEKDFAGDLNGYFDSFLEK